MASDCPLCHQHGGQLLWQNDLCRVVLAQDKDYAGLCRVIAQQHVQEMSDLARSQQMAMMQVVFAVEQVMREVLAPDKMNIASLGNKTPHVHWHIIPRFGDDQHFPEAIWATPIRPVKTISTEQIERLCARIPQYLTQTLGA